MKNRYNTSDGYLIRRKIVMLKENEEIIKKIEGQINEIFKRKIKELEKKTVTPCKTYEQ